MAQTQQLDRPDTIAGKEAVHTRQVLVARRATIGHQHPAQATPQRESRREPGAARPNDENIVFESHEDWNVEVI